MFLYIKHAYSFLAAMITASEFKFINILIIFVFHNCSRFQKFLVMWSTYGWLSGSKARRHPRTVSCWRWQNCSSHNAACNVCAGAQNTRWRSSDNRIFTGMSFIYHIEKHTYLIFHYNRTGPSVLQALSAQNSLPTDIQVRHITHNNQSKTENSFVLARIPRHCFLPHCHSPWGYFYIGHYK